jgi:hypothetical protein
MTAALFESVGHPPGTRNDSEMILKNPKGPRRTLTAPRGTGSADYAFLLWE